MEYGPNDREEIRRAYLQKGHSQPHTHFFSQKMIGQVLRRFNSLWFNEYLNWLEYNIAKDLTFCLCYHFKPEIGEQTCGSDFFVGEGFSNWKKKEKFKIHVGGSFSAHNQAVIMCLDLMNQK